MARLVVVSSIQPYQIITDIPCSLEEGEAMAKTINSQQSVIGRPALATCIPDAAGENESGRSPRFRLRRWWRRLSDDRPRTG